MIKDTTILSLKVRNGEAISIDRIPLLSYPVFWQEVDKMLKQDGHHCVSYFAKPIAKKLAFFCVIADDTEGYIHLMRHEQLKGNPEGLESITQAHFSMHIFEREIHENFGIPFQNHPWLKPVRYAYNQANVEKKINDYPFFKIESEELHEVGVGPIHAGVIEPGHFRFTCNGEMVLHLEIQHGWQHRGVENLMVEKKKLLQRNILSESISGDTAIGHSLAFVGAMEGLSKTIVEEPLKSERSIALELERIAVHVGDLSAMCTDVAYQLGNAALGALRTPIINFTQLWCGNRFGKGLIRVGGSHYLLKDDLIQTLVKVLDEFEKNFDRIATRTFSLPSILSRFENIGTITTKQTNLMGSVGMVARMAGIPRDIRSSHPFAAYAKVYEEPPIQSTGDVYARGMQRVKEIHQSIKIIRTLLREFNSESNRSKPIREEELKLNASSLVVSLTEGWRGEICHVALTDEDGELEYYKIKDPSMHNWKALELALRDLEISDFPINNKSFDLSYCGFDL